jgi:hypothetical protein
MTRSEEDFGFSFYSDEEMKANETALAKQLEATKQKVATTAQDIKEISNRVDQIKNAIMPLLNNLMKTPEKQYLLWPDRAAQIKAFIDKINKI